MKKDSKDSEDDKDPDGVWSDRYTSIEEWPGISMLKAVLDGEPIRGTWFNRTQEYRARLRKKKGSEPESFASEEIVVLPNYPAGATSVRRCIGTWWRGWSAKSRPTPRRKEGVGS